MYRFICFGLLVAFLGACLDPIDLESPPGQSDAVVVQGKLIKGNPSFLEVTIQKIFTFDATSDLINVSGVQLIAESGPTAEIKKIADGFYRTEFINENAFDLQEDDAYKIKVTLFDGRVIESSFEELQIPNAVDEIEFSLQDREIYDANLDRFDIRRKAILNLTSEISNIQQDPKRLRWSVQRHYKLRDSPDAYFIRERNSGEFIQPKTCFVTDDVSLTRFPLFDGFQSDRDQLSFESEIFDGTANDFRFSDTMYFSIVQEALSRDAFKYFTSISELINRSGSMFEPPAGQVNSNLVNVNDPDQDVFGFFYASNQIRSRILILPEMLGETVPAPLCPFPPGEGWRPGQCPFTDCCDCLSIPNSSTTKPDYWIE